MAGIPADRVACTNSARSHDESNS